MEEVLLPSDVRPIRYEIALSPDLVACTFSGSLSLTVSLSAPRAAITLHCHPSLAVKDASFVGADGKAVKAVSYLYTTATETLVIAFPALLTSGGTLGCKFAGVLNDEMAGFYRSKYMLRGESRWAAVTQFEATDARRCFPCIDEPSAKAVFGITVTAPADRTVLSGMSATRVTTSADGKSKTYTFADTPPQSTYLVAVCVGEWDAVSAVDPVSLVRTSVYTPVGRAASGEFALKVGVEALAYLTAIFGHPYMGGSKVDHIAIADFAAGAMENTGLITYREAALLIDEHSSMAMKQRVAQVVSHELSHQWFGNATTMKWWDCLWLNEGFAKHCEFAVTASLFPEWDTWSTFGASVQANAFSLDGMASTHAVEVAVANPEQINAIFDAISYSKGASIIRMAFTWLGYKAAWKGLNLYLARHKYGNTVTEDLWAALSDSTGKPVGPVMRRWVLRSGYPFLSISAAPGGSTYTLSSSRHIAAWARNPNAWPESSDFVGGASLAAAEAASAKLAVAPKDEADATTNYNTEWCIPLSAVVGNRAGGAEVIQLGVLALDPDAGAAEASLAPAGGRAGALSTMGAALFKAGHGAPFLKVNAGGGGFFRTIYSPELLATLVPACATPAARDAPPALSTTDRLGLVGDVAAGVAVGLTPSAALLHFLLGAFAFEADYNVWSAVLDALGDVKTSATALASEAERTATLAALDVYTVKLMGPVIALVGWDAVPGEGANTPLLRAMVLRTAALAGSQPVIDECLKRFDAAVAGKGVLSADLQQIVYNTAASVGGEPRWSALYKMFKSAATSEEQRRLMTALGRASEPALLSRALNLLLTEEVRSQDSAMIVGSVASNPGDTGRRLAWTWLKANWDVMSGKLGGGFMTWASVIGAAIRHFDAKGDADDVAAWFVSHPAGAAERTVKQAQERIRTVAWRAHILSGERDEAGRPFAAALAATT